MFVFCFFWMLFRCVVGVFFSVVFVISFVGCGFVVLIDFDGIFVGVIGGEL